MRYGFTTGSCAAAAAKAAAYMLLTGKEKSEIVIDTPKGIAYHAKIESTVKAEHSVSCAVRKDGGDDPDVTTGTLVYAHVSISKKSTNREIMIDGGIGVGRVTRPGLDQAIGNAAINRIPREMIQKEVREICELTDFNGSLRVVISVPEGEALAQKTFNPHLGIIGGISILGTTGIVEPMSTQALLDTIKLELNIKKAEGYETIVVTPGNYGLDFMKRTYGYDLGQSIKCSNFIGAAIDMAAEMGFKELLLVGHIGKLIKLSGGMMNTHSREGDCRMELLAAAAIRAGASADAALQILSCVTTQEAIAIIKETGKLYGTIEFVMQRICFYLEKRAGGNLKPECMLYANEFGELAKSRGAEVMLEKVKGGDV